MDWFIKIKNTIEFCLYLYHKDVVGLINLQTTKPRGDATTYQDDFPQCNRSGKVST